MNPRKVALLALGLLLLMVAASANTCSWMQKQTEKRAMAFKQTLKLETWPVGHFLVDLPVGAQVEFTQGYWGAGNDVRIIPCPLFKAKKVVDERVAELQGTKHLEGGTLLERVVESKTLPNTWILFYWKGRTYKGKVLEVDAYHWKESPESKDPFAGNAYLICFNRGSHTDEIAMKQDQAELEDLFRRVRIRDTRKIPTAPGFCVENGFFPGDEPGGSITITVRLPDHPDIFLRLEIGTSNEATVNGGTLLDRCGRNDKDPMFASLGMKKLRFRQREVGPLAGEENCEMVKEHGIWDMSFKWEYRGLVDNASHPFIALDLVSKRPKDSPKPLSLKEEEFLVLWDAIVDSIRLRPTTSTPTQPGK
jgi:hypothetical protein